MKSLKPLELKGLIERGNYRGLRLLDHVMKVLERVAENFLWQQGRIDAMQFGLMPGCSVTDLIFIARQSQKEPQANLNRLK